MRFIQAGYLARTTSKLEPRGQDGRGFNGPGLDHGVFVPFRLMFGEEFTDVPIVEVSMDASLDPEANWRIGQVVEPLRYADRLLLYCFSADSPFISDLGGKASLFFPVVS